MHRRTQLIALILALSSRAALAGVPIGASQTLVAVGDSITANDYPCIGAAGVCDSQSLVGQINTAFSPVVSSARAVLASGSRATLASGAPATVSQTSLHPTIAYINSGVGGNKTADIAAAVTTRITQYNPDVILLLIGVNDAINLVDIGTFTANYNSILSQIRSWSSTVQIVTLSILIYGEEYNAGPPLSWAGCNGSGIDARIDSFNSVIQSLSTTYNTTYVDLRSQILTWESTNNTPAPGVCSGPFAGGGPHPTIPTSERILDGWLFPSFTVRN